MKHISFLKVSFALSALLAGCGASENENENGNGSNTDSGVGGECVKVAETEVNCANGLDDNCDGRIDCTNTECAFDPACTGGSGGECGDLSFSGDPLPIPDGNGTAYETTLNISGFDNGQTLDTPAGFESVCVVMEHSWLRDLQIEMVCPSGEVLVLQKFLEERGRALYMGMPNHDDDGPPGTGTEYCWKADAVNPPMLDWATANPGPPPILPFLPPQPVILPAGDYRPYGSLDDLVGCTLNGEWKIRVVDDWEDDNGYIFEWNISFSEDIVPDCLIVID